MLNFNYHYINHNTQGYELIYLFVILHKNPLHTHSFTIKSRYKKYSFGVSVGTPQLDERTEDHEEQTAVVLFTFSCSISCLVSVSVTSPHAMQSLQLKLFSKSLNQLNRRLFWRISALGFGTHPAFLPWDLQPFHGCLPSDTPTAFPKQGSDLSRHLYPCGGGGACSFWVECCEVVTLDFSWGTAGALNDSFDWQFSPWSLTAVWDKVGFSRDPGLIFTLFTTNLVLGKGQLIGAYVLTGVMCDAISKPGLISLSVSKMAEKYTSHYS